jgi:C-terminal processing protease CtpA/Prc
MRHIVFATALGAVVAATFSARALADDQDQRGRQQDSQKQSQPDSQNRDASNRNQNDADEDDTEFRGMEHAALGVLLSERQGRGVRIRDVLPDGPADQAGLRPGDRITKLNGKPTNSYYDVIRQVNKLQPGQHATIAIQRNGEDKEIHVTAATREHVYGHGQQFSGERSQSQRERNGQNQDQSHYQNQYSNRQQQGGHNRDSYNDNWQDDQGRNQVANRRQQNRWSYRGHDQNRGVLGIDLDHQRDAAVIREVRPGSPAQSAGLRRGDEIVAVDGQRVRDSEDVMNDLQGREAGERVTLVVHRNGQQRSVQARLISAQQLEEQQGRDRDQHRDARQSDGQDDNRSNDRNQDDRRTAAQQDSDEQPRD